MSELLEPRTPTPATTQIQSEASNQIQSTLRSETHLRALGPRPDQPEAEYKEDLNFAQENLPIASNPPRTRSIFNLHDEHAVNGSLKIKLKVKNSRVTSASMVENPYELRQPSPPPPSTTFALPLKVEPDGQPSIDTGVVETNEIKIKNQPKSKSSSRRKSAPKSSKRKRQPEPHQSDEAQSFDNHKESKSSAVPQSESSVDEKDSHVTSSMDLPPPTTTATAKNKRTRVKRAASARVNQIAAIEEAEADEDNDGYANDFWSEIEEYRGELTPLDVDFCTTSKSGVIPRDSPLLVVPSLGPYYRETWIEEDDRELRKQLEPSHRPSKYRKLDEDGAKAGQTGPGGEKLEKASTESLDIPITPRVGSFTSRLLSAFVQESIVGQSFYNRPGEFDMDIEDYTVPVGSVPTKQAQIASLSSVEDRLAKELKSLGLLMDHKKLVEVSPGKGKDEGTESATKDEVLLELEKTQQELTALTRQNAEYRESRLLPKVLEAMRSRKLDDKVKTEVLEKEEKARHHHRELLKRRREKEKEKKNEPPNKKQRLNSNAQQQGRTLPPPKPEVVLPKEEEALPLIPSDEHALAPHDAIIHGSPLDADSAMDIDEEPPRLDDAQSMQDAQDDDVDMIAKALQDPDEEAEAEAEEEESGTVATAEGTAASDDVHMIEIDLAEDLLPDDDDGNA